MILGIIQARMNSKRLPGKVLKPLEGEPMLFRQYERVRRSQELNRLVVATSDAVSDNVIERMCQQKNIPCFRGSEEDVLDRFYQVACQFAPSHVVRLTADCPLSDPDLIDQVVRFHIKGNYDYTSNTIAPTYPDGLDVEVVRWIALETTYREAKLPSEREHVTSFLYNHPERFRLGNFIGLHALGHLRWTVDESADYLFAKKIYGALYQSHPNFSTSDILDCLAKHPKWGNINSHIRRDEGYAISLKKDKEYFK